MSVREYFNELYAFTEFLNRKFCGRKYVVEDSLLLRSLTIHLLLKMTYIGP
jgi:hypothetical protein